MISADSQAHLKEVMQSSTAWARYHAAIPVAEDENRIPKNFHTLASILTTARQRSEEIKTPTDRALFLEEVVVRLLADYVSDVRSAARPRCDHSSY